MTENPIEAPGSDPVALFDRWFEAARGSGEAMPEAVALATASAQGEPSVRMVLLKGFGPDGFVFFTNYESAKGRDLSANPRAALAFYWHRLHRQVRVEGRVARLSRARSAAYFRTRPPGSQISAAASPQSRPIKLDELEAEVARLTRLDPSGAPLPPDWGGYRLSADAIEFWQGRPNRLHDRFRYQRQGGSWVVERLAP